MNNNFTKIGRNNPCPCGNTTKYKNCCLGKVEWGKMFKNKEYFIPCLSNRGRNLFFIAKLSEILQLDNIARIPDLKDYKKLFTTQNVTKIFEAVIETWHHMKIYQQFIKNRIQFLVFMLVIIIMIY